MAINDTLYNINTVSFNQENVRLAEGKIKKILDKCIKKEGKGVFFLGN